jgi:hypothetical protein
MYQLSRNPGSLNLLGLLRAYQGLYRNNFTFHRSLRTVSGPTKKEVRCTENYTLLGLIFPITETQKLAMQPSIGLDLLI